MTTEKFAVGSLVRVVSSRKRLDNGLWDTQILAGRITYRDQRRCEWELDHVIETQNTIREPLIGGGFAIEFAARMGFTPL